MAKHLEGQDDDDYDLPPLTSSTSLDLLEFEFGHVDFTKMSITKINKHMDELAEVDNIRQVNALFSTILDGFHTKWDWLGEQVAEEFLISMACHIVSKFYVDIDNTKKEFQDLSRYRRHLFLRWGAGWWKSTMMRHMKQILPTGFVTEAAELNNVAFRGSVDSTLPQGERFIVPSIMTSPIVVFSEFNKNLLKDNELRQHLLRALQGDSIAATLKLYHTLTIEERDALRPLGISWPNSITMNYQCSTTIWTASQENIGDPAAADRFSIVAPGRSLTSELLIRVDPRPLTLENSEMYDFATLSYNTIQDALYHFLTQWRPTIYVAPNIDKYIIKYNLSPRQADNLITKIIGYQWWGIRLSKEKIEAWATLSRQARLYELNTAQDMIAVMLEEGWCTVEELQYHAACAKRTVYQYISNMKQSGYRILKNGNKFRATPEVATKKRQPKPVDELVQLP